MEKCQCPICGNEDAWQVDIYTILNNPKDDQSYKISCKICNSSSYQYIITHEAIEYCKRLSAQEKEIVSAFINRKSKECNDIVKLSYRHDAEGYYMLPDIINEKILS